MRPLHVVHLAPSLPRLARVFLLIVVRSLLSGGRLMPRRIFFHQFFVTYFDAEKRRKNVDPTRSSEDSSRLLYPPPERHHLLFDCCVFSSIGSRLKPGPQPSLYFAMGRISSPKAAPTARMKTNRACPTSHTMVRSCASRRAADSNGRRQRWRRTSSVLGKKSI